MPSRTAVAGIGLGLSLLSFAASAQTPGQPPDTMAARVEACTSCHGNKGEGTSDVYFPRLAGKPAGYLYNQLVAFRNGRRKYPPMNYLLEFLPDPYQGNADGKQYNGDCPHAFHGFHNSPRRRCPVTARQIVA